MLGVGILLPYSFSTLVTMAGLGGKGVFMIVLTLAAAWLADSGAYFCGTFFGKTKLCPEISPQENCGGSYRRRYLKWYSYAYNKPVLSVRT